MTTVSTNAEQDTRPRRSSPVELRMLSPLERKATRMAWEGADLVDIADATGLTFPQIREAVALQAKWKHEDPPPGWQSDPTPGPQPEPEPGSDPPHEASRLPTPAPACAADEAGSTAAGPVPPQIRVPSDMRSALREDAARNATAAERLQAEADAARDDELEQLVRRRPAQRTTSVPPGDVDLTQMVRDAERSGDTHARSLAARIRRLADDLSAHLAIRTEIDLAHQRISTLQTEVQFLRRLVQQRDAHRPQTTTSARGETPETAALKPTDDPRYSSIVRDWAQRNGMAVAARGRVARDVVEAYLAAHPQSEATATLPASSRAGEGS